MMNETGPYTQDVFVADFTEYNNNHPETPAPHAGVLIATEENGIIPSFKLTDKNEHPFTAVNFEENPAVFMREDGTKVSQCECMFYAIREASPAWMLFLELKYCAPKNAYNNIIDGIWVGGIGVEFPFARCGYEFHWAVKSYRSSGSCLTRYAASTVVKSKD